jgi:hypothetical protein
MAVGAACRWIPLLLAGITALAASACVPSVIVVDPPAGGDRCVGVAIRPGDDLDAAVNADPRSEATTFCVGAAAAGTVYRIDQPVVLGPGDRLLGERGQVAIRGPARYGLPLVRIRPAVSLPVLIRLVGPGTELWWLDIAGGEAGVTVPRGDSRTVLAYLAVHDNTRKGIGQMRGRLLHSELYRNGTDPLWWGFDATAVKGVDEYEAAFDYVHDNPANGLWCDHGCADAGTPMRNGFWVHDSLLVDNGRWGVRYEQSPHVPSGVRRAEPTALVERNEIHGNGYQDREAFGGASMWDAQHATFRDNVFGAATIAGVSYRGNAGGLALLFRDSPRLDRTDLWAGVAVGNVLRGEWISGCGLPDDVVWCSANHHH